MSADTPVTSLSDLKVGDSVIHDTSRYGYPNRAIATVTKVTRTQIAISPRDQRFNRQTGREVGSSGSYTAAHLYVATPELVAEVNAEHEKRTLERRLSDIEWGRVPLETLRTIYNTLRTPAS